MRFDIQWQHFQRHASQLLSFTHNAPHIASSPALDDLIRRPFGRVIKTTSNRRRNADRMRPEISELEGGTHAWTALACFPSAERANAMATQCFSAHAGWSGRGPANAWQMYVWGQLNTCLQPSIHQPNFSLITYHVSYANLQKPTSNVMLALHQLWSQLQYVNVNFKYQHTDDFTCNTAPSFTAVIKQIRRLTV